ncbi:transcription factor 7-like 1 isoform X1 [Paralichthys olivaceus]|uniref:transcription factor 7-like 1 isoform X1 n=1 Tax=Paralichthys olivaceus TaxID=8255 RepID=UPI003752A350
MIFLAVLSDCPLLDAAGDDEKELYPKQSQLNDYMTLDAEPLSLQQPILPAPEHHAAPAVPIYPLPTVQQPILPAPEHHAAPAVPMYPLPTVQQPILPAPEHHAEPAVPMYPLPTVQQPCLPAPEHHAAPAVPMYPLPTVQQPCLPAPEHHAEPAVPMYPLPTVQQPCLPAPEHHAAPAVPMYPLPTVQQPGLWYNQAAPSNYGQFSSSPVENLSQGLGSNLAPVGFLNGEVVYQLLPYTAPVLASNYPPVNCLRPKKTKFHRQSNNENQPYVKKPQNAFMIYLKEQRPKVVAELGNSDCATVNKVIGQKWKSLSSMEQAIYYEQAERERQLHLQLFPEWSASDNYGKKRKRIRRKGPAMTLQTVI